MKSVASFINFDNESQSFIQQDTEANDTLIAEQVNRHTLDWNRLRDGNDDYDEILFYPER